MMALRSATDFHLLERVGELRQAGNPESLSQGPLRWPALCALATDHPQPRIAERTDGDITDVVLTVKKIFVRTVAIPRNIERTLRGILGGTTR